MTGVYKVSRGGKFEVWAEIVIVDDFAPRVWRYEVCLYESETFHGLSKFKPLEHPGYASFECRFPRDVVDRYERLAQAKAERERARYESKWFVSVPS
jgi:hypothetical protein